VADHITLLGAEQVQTAANTMRNAAEEMSRAASNLDYALENHRRYMDDWLSRFETIIDRTLTAKEKHIVS
jgi:hypothetical protein